MMSAKEPATSAAGMLPVPTLMAALAWLGVAEACVLVALLAVTEAEVLAAREGVTTAELDGIATDDDGVTVAVATARTRVLVSVRVVVIVDDGSSAATSWVPARKTAVKIAPTRILFDLRLYTTDNISGFIVFKGCSAAEKRQESRRKGSRLSFESNKMQRNVARTEKGSPMRASI